MALKIAQVATVDLSVHLLLLDQIKALEADGHEVVAICSPGAWVEKVRSEGVTVETIPMEREISPLKDIRSLLAWHNALGGTSSTWYTLTPPRPG